MAETHGELSAEAAVRRAESQARSGEQASEGPELRTTSARVRRVAPRGAILRRNRSAGTSRHSRVRGRTRRARRRRERRLHRVQFAPATDPRNGVGGAGRREAGRGMRMEKRDRGETQWRRPPARRGRAGLPGRPARLGGLARAAPESASAGYSGAGQCLARDHAGHEPRNRRRPARSSPRAGVRLRDRARPAAAPSAPTAPPPRSADS